MPHSTVTSKGQTTIPGKIRKALRIKPGDKLEYLVEGDHATIRVRDHRAREWLAEWVAPFTHTALP